MLKAFSTKQEKSIPEILFLVQEKNSTATKPKKYITHDHQNHELLFMIPLGFFYTEKKKCLLKDMIVALFLWSPEEMHSPKGFWRVCHGQCCMVQCEKPCVSSGAELCEKGCRKPDWGQDACRNFSCISASALTPVTVWAFCSSAHTCPHLPLILNPCLALELLHSHVWGCSPQSRSACHLWAVGWGCGERSLLCLALLPPCHLPWQCCGQNPSPRS